MSNKPLVSIGLPTYNRAAILQQAIESVLNQDYQNFELVISDNASTDETEAICRDAARHDNRIKYFRQQTNQGATPNFREVLRRSSGEFFAWLNDDDWLDQSYVGRCVQVLLDRPDYSLVCGKTRYFREGKLAFEGVLTNLPQERASDRVLAYYRMVSDNGTFYGLMRRAQLREVPLRNTMGGDWLYVASVAFVGKVETLEDTCLNRSLGGSSVTYEKIAEILGLSHFAAAHPRFSIAQAACRDILSSPVYARCGMLGRLSFGCQVFALIERRQGFYGRRTPRDRAVTALKRVLPASIVDKIRNRRRPPEAKVCE